MSINIEPATVLGFQRPFSSPTTTHLKVHNPNSKPVQVKIKTTSPKAYSVRPNFSRVEPGETIEVAVTLLPMTEEPPLNARCKDKFLVCSAVIPVEKEGTPLTELWNDIQANHKDEVHEQKLRCVYLASSESIPEHPTQNGDSSQILDTTHYDNAMSTSTIAGASSLSAHDSTSSSPNALSSGSALKDSGPQSTGTESKSDRAMTDTSDSKAAVPPTSVSVAKSGSTQNTNTAASSAQISNLSAGVKETIEEQLAAAKKEIARLQESIANSPQVTGLRRRVGQLGDTDEVKRQANEVTQQISQNGVPMPTVVLIAIIVFLITYLFF